MATYHFIVAEKAQDTWPVRVMCRVLKVSASAFYRWFAAPHERGRSDCRVRVHIRAIHRKSRGTYGAPHL